MGHDVALQVVDVDEGDVQTAGETFGEAHADEQRAHEARATCEGDGRQLLLGDAGALDGLIDHRHHVLLVGAAGQFGHYATVGAVHLL